MKKPLILISFLVLIIVVLFGARTVVSNRISTSGVELGATQDDLSFYKTENTILKEKIYALSSLTSVSERAKKLGFVESKDTFAVSKSLPIALKQ